MKRILCISTLLFPLLSLANGDDAVTMSHAYVRAMAPGQHVTAVYMDIKNTSNEPIAIVNVSSPDAPEVQMHTNIEKNGVMKMQQIDELELAPNSTTFLKPGGNHIMLMDLSKPLTPQSKPITLVFEYEDGTKTTVDAIPVKDMRKK